ncbi:MAG: F0F1 ATP synthase subunit alpha [Oscillospiraceae bacterium]|jgi:F-type H+-transporting ATPase subunit alpha|nr:F0F1 ATP synthase subunit alpha [Oscillospiraceae bacterium]
MVISMEKPILVVASKQDGDAIAAIRAGFSEKLGRPLDFEIVEDEKITGGFIAIVDGTVYDNSYSSRLHDFGRRISASDDGETPRGSSFATVGAVLKHRVSSVESGSTTYKYGEVVSFADDIIQISGLSGCHYGELLDFGGGAIGLTLDLRLDGVGAALLDGSVSTSSVVHPTGRVAEICVGNELLGRVVDPLGRPLDGRDIRAIKYRPVEAPAPSITQRAPVNAPLETGILTVDSMIPIGRGQRELIIGDRQTGKTSIAVSTIINQVNKGVYCVYCAIGQKASTVSGIVRTLERAGAMENTVVVTAFSSSAAAMQYIAPYAACAVAEEFMYAGRDVVVVYDDLSKHAVAYRSMSLLLRRPSGREAYPGDVFYLHSRLLERAAHLSNDLGGGSITALPIVETMAGDISAYIPTNVISITDGQIYLESELFNSGQRPAVNVGLSVSRVGRSAQHKAMRAVSGSMRLNVAQYRDMAVFAQFGADIDSSTAAMLRSGERLMELLKQPSDTTFSLAEQTAILLAFSAGAFDGFERGDIDDARNGLLRYLSENADKLMRNINATGALSENDRSDLLRHFEQFSPAKGGGDDGGTE